MSLSRRLVLGGLLASTALGLAACETQNGRWTQLGSAQISLLNARALIPVSVTQGFFTALRVNVAGQPVFINALDVQFGNGQRTTLAVNTLIPAGSQTQPILLPGGARTISVIHIQFLRVATGGTATVTVFGRPL